MSLPCGRIIFQSFVVLMCLFFVAVFPAAGGVDAFVPRSDDSVFLNAALFLSRASDARRRCSRVLKVSAAAVVVLKRQNSSFSGESRCEPSVFTQQEKKSFFIFSYAAELAGFSSIEVKQFRENSRIQV